VTYHALSWIALQGLQIFWSFCAGVYGLPSLCVYALCMTVFLVKTDEYTNTFQFQEFLPFHFHSKPLRVSVSRVSFFLFTFVLSL
jgi:hypothetical protein